MGSLDKSKQDFPSEYFTIADKQTIEAKLVEYQGIREVPDAFNPGQVKKEAVYLFMLEDGSEKKYTTSSKRFINGMLESGADDGDWVSITRNGQAVATKFDIKKIEAPSLAAGIFNETK